MNEEVMGHWGGGGCCTKTNKPMKIFPLEAQHHAILAQEVSGELQTLAALPPTNETPVAIR